jgi:hypothetical protein
MIAIRESEGESSDRMHSQAGDRMATVWASSIAKLAATGESVLDQHRQTVADWRFTRATASPMWRMNGEYPGQPFARLGLLGESDR